MLRPLLSRLPLVAPGHHRPSVALAPATGPRIAAAVVKVGPHQASVLAILAAAAVRVNTSSL
jgi:hypothetical protein